MDVLLVYDLQGGNAHSAIKAAMLKRGYFDHWTSEGNTIYLPSTSLWKKNIDLATAYNDMIAVIKDYNIKNWTNTTQLSRFVATPSTPWYAILGKPH